MDEVGQYYTQEKANRCVVCGSSGSYIRKNVVPHEYRKHFPGKLSIKLCSTSVMLLIVVFPCILISTRLFLPTNALFIKT